MSRSVLSFYCVFYTIKRGHFSFGWDWQRKNHSCKTDREMIFERVWQIYQKLTVLYPSQRGMQRAKILRFA